MKLSLHDRARLRLGGERGGPVFTRDGAVRFALAFPNRYRLGMASLGFQLVHEMLNNPPRSSCERVFLPEDDEIAEHQRTGMPLFSLETLRPVRGFDVVAFSVSYEMDYLNVVRMLELAGIPPERCRRAETDPLVLVGGVCASFNPEPLADFVDVFAVGEAEAVLPGLVNALEQELRAPRAQLLESLCSLPGIYVPAYYEPRYDSSGRLVEIAAAAPAPPRVRRAAACDLSGFPAESRLRTGETEFGDLTLVELSRGCARRCRFCVTGHVVRPVRHRQPSVNFEAPRVGLVGASVFDHPQAEAICRSVADAGGEFTVSSVRLESVTPERARLLAAGGQKTLTIAPEAATRRLRRVIGKDCSDDAVTGAVASAAFAGIRKVKLYFMLGLPTETDEDVEGIAGMLRKLTAEFPGMSLQVSASVFVPKPWTPFQWCAFERPEVLKSRLESLRKSLGRLRGVSFSAESPRLAAVQALFARGDRRTGHVLAAALANGGRFAAAMKECGINPEEYLYRNREEKEVFPWDHIDTGLSKASLWQDYRRALDQDSHWESEGDSP